MTPRIVWGLSVSGAVLIAIAGASLAWAQEQHAFTHRPALAGDAGVQNLQFRLDLKTTLAQSGQTIQSSDRSVVRDERRRVVLLEIDDQHAKARVTYEKSEQTSLTNKQGQPVSQPVTGKTYFVTRVGEKLTVTDEQGKSPPTDEVLIVKRSMEGLGKPNPLSVYLNGKKLAVGETVRLPNEVAADLFGLRDAVSDVARFEMKLVELRDAGGRPAALFETTVEAKSPATGGGVLRLAGYSLVEVDTCRPLATDLTGPVRMTETRGPKGGQYTVTGEGTIRLAIHAQRDTPRR